ncbi:MAG: hypothetical protein GX643_06705, partial [Acidimicrobiales bacterium]|nr:hypothetical protein [Acidimicrobiales bacterium]
MFDLNDNEAFQRHLSRVAEARREHSRLVTRRATLEADLETAAEDIKARREQLVKEHEDVTKLESFSLSRVFNSMRGERDEELRREMAERETARLALLAAEEHQRETLQELVLVDDRLAALGDVEADWAEAIEARQRWVEVTSGQLRTRDNGSADSATVPAAAPELSEAGTAQLAELIERRAVVESDLREVDEALAAAHLLAAKLAHTAAVLGSGQSWAAYQSWLGEDSGTGSYDRDKLDEAATALRDVDGLVTLLRRELDDLARLDIIKIEVGEWDRTFDSFLHHLLQDESIEDKVKAAAEKVAQLRVEISRVISLVVVQGQRLVTEANDLVATRD